MDDSQLFVIQEPEHEAIRPVLDGVESYGIGAIGGRAPARLAVLLRSDEDGVVGGGVGHEIRGVFYLSHLWVAPERRSRGLGGRILAAMEREAAALGCCEVRLDTLNARSLPFYLRHGYEPYARIPEYIPGFERVFLRKA